MDLDHKLVAVAGWSLATNDGWHVGMASSKPVVRAINRIITIIMIISEPLKSIPLIRTPNAMSTLVDLLRDLQYIHHDGITPNHGLRISPCYAAGRGGTQHFSKNS